MTGSAQRVLVAGTAGGVGTTTVTALLFSSWMGRAGAPQLADHTAGTLGLRLAEGDEAGRIDPGTVLIDAGAQAFTAGAEVADPSARLILVTAATRLGCALAGRCLAELGDDPVARTVVVVNGGFGRHRIRRPARALTTDFPGLAGLVIIRADLALAAGGRIPLSRLTRHTRRAVDEVAGLVSGMPAAAGVRVSG